MVLLVLLVSISIVITTLGRALSCVDSQDQL